MTGEPALFSNPYEQENEEELGVFDAVGDIAAAPFRGIAGAATGIINLTGAELENPLGESQTMVGGLFEGLTQFLVGFVPGAGILSRAGGALSKYSKIAAAAGKTAKGARALKAAKNAGAGAIADFAVFDGNDPRFSNLIQDIPGLENPLTEFLAADEDAKAGDLSERMKNVIEGAGLGLVADGLMGLIGAVRKYNKAVKTGDPEAALKAEKEAEAIATEVFDRPVDGTDAAAEDLLEPELVGQRRPEREGIEELPDPEDVPEGIEESSVDRISMRAAEERLGYDPQQGLVVVAKPGDADNTIRGFSQFDSFVREPDARMQIVQLKEDARVLRAKSPEARAMVGKKPRGMSRTEHEKLLLETAKDNGYDAVSFGRGNRVETEILSEDAIHQRVNVESKQPFWEKRAAAQQIKIPDIVQNSRVEAAIHNMDLTPDTAEQFAKAWREAVDSPGEDHMESMAKIINLEKQGERSQRAFFKVFAEEFDHIKEPEVSWEKTIADSSQELAKMMGADPNVLSKQFDTKAEEVGRAANMAVGIRKYFDIHMKRLVPLAQQLVDGDLPLDASGNVLSKEAATEMLARNLESLQGLTRSVSRLRSASGRLLNTFKIGVGDMSQNALMRSLELRGGNVNHILKTAKQIVEDAKIGDSVALSRIARNSRKGRFMAALTDYYMFSLLSAPKTLTTNILGAGLTMVYKPAETSLGAWVGKKLMSPEAAQAFERTQAVNMRRITIMRNMMMEATGLRKKLGQDAQTVRDATSRSFAKGEGTLTGNQGWLDSGDPKNPGLSLENLDPNQKIDPASTMGQALKMLFKGTQLPSRFMGASDEFIKQIAYHSHIRAELIEQANEQGIGKLKRPGEPTVDQWVDQEMRKMTLNGEAMTQRAIRNEAEGIYPREMFADQANREQHIQDYLEKKMGDVDPETGRTVEARSALAEEALRVAREVTFTSPLDPEGNLIQKAGSYLQQLAEAHPTMRFFTPFIRTPLNLLMFTADRLPIPGMNKDFLPMVQYLGAKAGVLPKGMAGATNRFVQEITSTNPQKAAEAFGRATTAMGVLSVVGGAAFSGLITGAGPSDIEQRKVLEATGWQPYSINIGGTYVSYQRLDPFASALSIAADISDVTRYGGSDQELEELALGWAAATIENLSSKSYLSGVMDLMELLSDPERNAPKTAGRLAGSLIPNVLAAQRGFTDKHQDEMQGMLDRIKARIPFMSEDKNLQRNALGEPVNKKTFGGALKVAEGLAGYLLPIQINTTGDDALDTELADLAFPFRPPGHSKFGVDLRDYRSDTGQTAYDRWQQLTSQVKIGGRGVRSALSRMVNSRRYQSLEKQSVDQLDLESPRIQMISSIVGKYRRQAERMMLREFPDLQEHTLSQRQARQSLRAGSNTSDIAGLLGGR